MKKLASLLTINGLVPTYVQYYRRHRPKNAIIMFSKLSLFVKMAGFMTYIVCPWLLDWASIAVGLM